MTKTIYLNEVAIINGTNTDQAVLEKTKELRILIPGGLLREGKKTKSYRHFFYFGILPERVRPFGKKRVLLPREYVVGVADYMIELNEWPAEAIRFVKIPPKYAKEFLNAIVFGLRWFARDFKIENIYDKLKLGRGFE
jgi:hypothetical protein